MSYPPWKSWDTSLKCPILHQIRHETWLYANGTWPNLKTHHHLLHTQRTTTITQVNFWNQCSCRSIPWRNPPNTDRYSQCQGHIWRHTHIWEDRQGTQLSTTQSTTASSELWTYPKSSEMHLQYTTNWILQSYLLNMRCCTHPRPNNCLTQCHKTHHHHWNQTNLKYGEL